ELNERIQELETQITPLDEELRRLKKQRAGKQAAKASIAVRRASKAERDARIEQALCSRIDDRYKRSGGLIKSVAQEFGVSTRTVSRIFAASYQDIYE